LALSIYCCALVLSSALVFPPIGCFPFCFVWVDELTLPQACCLDALRPDGGGDRFGFWLGWSRCHGEWVYVVGKNLA
jgi:hypothetical protein